MVTVRGPVAWASAEPSSTSIWSGKVQIGPPGDGGGVRLGTLAHVQSGSSWAGPGTPGGMLSAVPWSVAPLRGLSASDLPTEVKEERTVLLAGLVLGRLWPPSRDYSPLPTAILARCWDGSQAPFSIPVPKCHLFPAMTVPPSTDPLSSTQARPHDSEVG